MVPNEKLIYISFFPITDVGKTMDESLSEVKDLLRPELDHIGRGETYDPASGGSSSSTELPKSI